MGYTWNVISRQICKRIVAVACALFLSSSVAAQTPAEKPLPDLTMLWERVRANLGVQYDANQLLRGYTYRRHSVIEELDSDGSVNDREIRHYDVFHFDSGMFQRLIRKNNMPLSEKDVKNEEERFRRFQKRERRERSVSDQEKVLNDVINAFEFKILRREMRNDRPTLILSFKPKKDAKVDTLVARRVFAKAEGMAWIDEEDAHLTRIDIHFIDDVKFGFGLLASMSKDSHMTRDWRKINSEVWAPFHNEQRIKARVLLAKGYNRRRIDDYMDFKKFSVETTINVLGAKP